MNGKKTMSYTFNDHNYNPSFQGAMISLQALMLSDFNSQLLPWAIYKYNTNLEVGMAKPPIVFAFNHKSLYKIIKSPQVLHV